MSEHYQLVCPVRGLLKTSAKRADGLKPSEEYFRVEAIKHLVDMGYPKSHFKIEAVVKKFGNAGRNNLRADFAVLDVPAGTIPTGDVDGLMNHAILLCEVKREGSASDYVKNTQVKPLLDFSKLDECIGLYWDDIDQRVFWNERISGKRAIRQGPLTFLPKFGRRLNAKAITFEQTAPADNLLEIFRRIEDLLHGGAIDPEQRFQIILQVLLAKLYDEHDHSADPKSEMSIQDYRALGLKGTDAQKEFNATLSAAASFYQKYLPNKIAKAINGKVNGELLMDITEIISPIRLISSKRDVIQAFYMHFAKGVYKWDMAQYFTPPSVTDFIVEILNPQFGEHIKDPACGSADFLTAAFHRRRDIDPGYASCIWGADNSTNAVQVAVLNMLINGDGKTNIKELDSLLHVDNELSQYKIMVCNPPFGIKITEKRKDVLKKYDLGYVWSRDPSALALSKGGKLLESQEVGILFTELCVKQCVPGGRIGIILPNGYLGNRSEKYQVFREWLLRHCRLVAICSFPRFTFKTSGADVSASVIYLEKLRKPLSNSSATKNYNFSVQVIENVGWNLGDKRAAPRYVRNEDDGSFVIDDGGNRILDADFENALKDLRQSPAAKEFPWLVKAVSGLSNSSTGWSLPITSILNDPDLTMDPKRHCRKVVELRHQISQSAHFTLGDALDVIGELKDSDGKKIKIDPKNIYKYVELQDISHGEYDSVELRGWQLPQRAKHLAEPGDIYVGGIWGSVAKWCYVGSVDGDIMITNGCYRLRIKPGKESLLEDILAFICTEAYAVQMRSLARGSDGLAEVTPDDLKSVFVPKLGPSEKSQIRPFVDALKAGAPDLRGKVANLLRKGKTAIPDVPIRPSHVVLV